MFHGKPKDLVKKASDYHDAFAAAQARDKAKLAPAVAVRQEISKHRAEKAKDGMKRAREAALQAMGKRKAARTVVLKSTT